MKNNLEKLRNGCNLTQEQLANKLKVTRQTINSIENGKYNPSIILAFKISKFFNTTIENVFIFQEDSYE